MCRQSMSFISLHLSMTANLAAEFEWKQNDEEDE